MSNNRFPLAMMLAGFMLFGADAMAQRVGNDNAKSMKHMKHMKPEQYREQHKNLTPEQRKKMKAKHSIKGNHQRKCDNDHPREPRK